MYKTKMANKPIFIILFHLFLLCIVGWGTRTALAETTIQDTITLEIAHDLWYNRYPEAFNKCGHLIEKEKNNPLGYFLSGSIYQTVSEEYRNDSFQETITDYLDKAIELARDKIKTDADNPDWYFICGASYGYRGLNRAFHGSWWGAFQDGLHCSSNLSKALRLDSTYYDAYLGLGAYHYYKTVKSRLFLWLPFVVDRREQGIEELQKCITNGRLATYNARESLLRIYYEEKLYDKMIPLADSLEKYSPDDAYCLLFYTRGLTELNRLDEAEQKLIKLRHLWEQSPYYDSIGIFEAYCLQADILNRHGDSDSAKIILENIISGKARRKENAYYEETLDNAKKIIKRIK